MFARAALQLTSPLLDKGFTKAVRRMRCSTAPILALFFCIAAGLCPAYAQVYHVQEMNTTRIQSLDRRHTAVILVGGILEEHGPYLPSYADGYVNEFIAQQVANAIAARPGWKVLMFPPIPLGSSGANDIGGKLRFPGTYDVREPTLRAVFVDLASDLGDQGFRWIFVLHNHGGPTHRLALDQVADFFRATYGGHMVNLWEIRPPTSERLSALMAAHGLDSSGEDGFSIHAGAHETSRLLSVRPDLVDPAYKQAPPLTGRNFGDLRRIAAAPDWPGYFGSPRLSSKEYGDEWIRIVAQTQAEYALKILDGLDERSVPRWTIFSGRLPRFLLSPAALWLAFGLTILWLVLVARSVFRFLEWHQALRRRDRWTAKALFRDMFPLLLAVLAAVFVVRALPILGFPLSMLRLAPDVSHTLLLLACVTLLLSFAKLAIIAAVFVKTKKAARVARQMGAFPLY